MDFQFRIQRALERARSELLSSRNSDGYWTGELSSSALATATAVCALVVAEKNKGAFSGAGRLISAGLQWLASNANADGGWGDTVISKSNVSTTTLCWAALGAAPGAHSRYPSTIA